MPAIVYAVVILLCLLLIHMFCRQNNSKQDLYNFRAVYLCKKVVDKLISQKNLEAAVPEFSVPRRIIAYWDGYLSAIYASDSLVDPFDHKNDFRVLTELFSGNTGKTYLYAIFHVLPRDGKWVSDVYRFKNGMPYLETTLDIDEKMKKNNKVESWEILEKLGPRKKAEKAVVIS